ncbi:YgfZ/GcvT domain-containing protein [Congregibacter litoralis]|uniref:CAF17-like 4Fe-4S cluster assembly/insertion protein YgfZ n=1 Tax=Congregibacter litoralis TaxID=393662 RepID=UPI0012601D27|nr:folate-binding protein YgfZ [Congregibacter litoralis]
MDSFACFLPGEAMLHLRGSKVPEFLQGQLTCDTRKLGPERALMGALCNVKGRVLSDLTVLYVSDAHLILRLRRSVAATIAKTLERYAQFSRISVELAAEEHSILGLGGRDFAAECAIDGDRSDAADSASNTVSPGSLPVTLRDDALLLQRGPGHGEVIAIDDAPARALASQGTASGSQADVDPVTSWEAATLRTGHYALELEDLECFTPQALNYDLSGLVAFDKGCYTGQEIVARLHYKGRSKKRLQIFEGPETLGPIARDTSLQGESGEIVGSCLRRASYGNGRALIAGEVHSDHLNQTLFLPGGERLDAITPPYLSS